MGADARATIAVWRKVRGESVTDDLLDACERLEGANGDVVLDLSSVRRIDPGAISAIDELATRADELGVRIALRGVNVEVYKVLKLVRLAPHFVFVN
ncbi:MAG TPA: STAS domain-containing protein [Terriglobales bacterium]|nr:STAS domain-containing protein [Terriglobales bacterium]